MELVRGVGVKIDQSGGRPGHLVVDGFRRAGGRPRPLNHRVDGGAPPARDNIGPAGCWWRSGEVGAMIRGVHTMFYSSEPEALRTFLRDKLGFSSFTDVGEGWLIFDLPEADMGVHPSDEEGGHGLPAGTHDNLLLLRRSPGHGRGARGTGRRVRRRRGGRRIRPHDPLQDAGRGARHALPAPLSKGRRLTQYGGCP